MRKQRALSSVLSAFIICSIIFGPTSVSATYNTLDDLEIDPWGDLENIQGFEPPTPELAPDDFEPVTMFPDMGLYAIGGYNGYTMTADADVRLGYLWTNGVSAGGNQDAYVAGTPVSFPFESDGIMRTELYRFGPEMFTKLTLSYAPMVITITNDTVYQPGKYILDGRLGMCFWLYYAAGSSSAEPIVNWPNKVEIYNNGSVIFSAEASGTGNYFFTETEVDVGVAGPLEYKFYYNQFARTCEFNGINATAIVGATLYDNVTVTNSDPELGLLEGVIEWLKSIRDGILELPQNIANFILEGLQGLFVPDQEDFADLMEKYQNLLSERLGFVYQGFDYVVDFFSRVLSALQTAPTAGDAYSFTFPGISFPYNGEILVIVPEQEVNLDNPAMDVIRPVLGTIVGFSCVLGFINLCFDLVVAMANGVGYSEFIGRRREEEDV